MTEKMARPSTIRREVVLGDIATFSYGTMPKKERIGTGIYPTFSGYKYQYTYPEYNCDAGDLIVVARGVGGTGDVKIVKEKCYLTNLSIKIDADRSQLDYEYFCYLHALENLAYLDSGSAQSQITITDLAKAVVELPALSEQKAVVDIVKSLDDKIDLLHRQNKTLEAMAETLFRQWFVEEAQEDWAETSLEAQTEAARGLSYKGSGLAPLGIGLPMHNLNSVFEGGGYKESGIKYYSGEIRERHILKAGDIIVANTEQGHEFRLIGFPAIIPATFGATGIFSQHIYRLTPRASSYLTPEYLFYLLMTPYVREQVIAAANGSTVNMLAIDGLQRPVFSLPPKDMVLRFTDMVRRLRQKSESNRSQIRTLESLRDTLLPKLMSGEVRVRYELEAA